MERGEYTVESLEYRHEQADGSYRWVEFVASSDPTPDGYYVVNTGDVSHRKERERTLERSNERLQEFASVVSHDLRNPLNVAQGRLQLVREASNSEHLDDVGRAYERMRSLIDDLLTLARTGKRVQEMESVDLAALAETCWRTVTTADASLVVDIDQPMRVDQSRVSQRLENMMRNAIEHGSEQVTVTAGELDERSGVYVADDGPGVADDRRERVLERGCSTQEDGSGF